VKGGKPRIERTALRVKLKAQRFDRLVKR